MSSDEETEEFSSWKGIPATLICINTYGPGKLNSAQVAYTATCRMMRQYLRNSNSQLIGICLYGTEGSNTSVFGIRSVEEVFPLSLPSLENYKKLQNVDISSLKQAKELTLSDVLWYCNKAFASCKKQLSTRTVIMLSRFDIPPLQSDEKPALKRVVDLVDSNIEIKLINISEKDYEINEFYSKFLIEANKGEDVALPKPVWDHKTIEQLMHQQSHRHLAVARLSFEIGEGFAIGVGVYNLLKSSGYTQQKTDLHSDTNAILTSVNKTMKIKVENGEQMDVDELGDEQESKPVPLLKSETLYYVTYGDEKIEFTVDERKTLNNPFGPPMLKLLGFKPDSIMCKEKWYYKPGYFLFPNESIIEGSIVAFKALHQACTEMKKVAICVLCTRVNARPTIVALCPTSKPLGLNAEIGFDIICIPFVENVRDIPVFEEDEDMGISIENKTLMKVILFNLQFDYKPDMFENPKLQAQYNAIEAIALEDEEVEPFVDTTKPDIKRFEEGIPVDLFQEQFGPFGACAVKNAASSRAGPESKRAKLVANIDEELLKNRLDNQKVKDYTVSQLKDILKYKEVPDLPAMTGLKKGELVDLVYKYCK